VIEERAQVVSAEGDELWVETRRQSACGQCAAKSACGTHTLSRVMGNKRNRVRVLNPGATPVRIGDEVVIGLTEHALVRGSLAVYLMPLLSLFVFGVLGKALAEQLLISSADLLVAAFGVIGLLLGFAWVRRFSRIVASDPRYQPVLLRRVLPREMSPISLS